MQRIIGTTGATLALALVMATSAAPASASGPGISGDGIDQDDLVSASNSSVYRIDPNTGIGVAENISSVGIDFNPTVDKIRATSAAGESLRLNPDEGAVLLNDGSLNPGTPQVVGSAYTNAEWDDDSDLLGDESQDPDLGGLDGDPPVTGGGEDISQMRAQLFEADEGDDWFDEFDEEEDDEVAAQTTMEWHAITSYEQLPAYPSANDVYMSRTGVLQGSVTSSGGRWDRGIAKTIGLG